MNGLLMCRVSSKEQKEGYSLESQQKFGRDYAMKNKIEIVREWIVSESAQKKGRIAFGEMLQYARRHPEIKCLLFEKPDRMSRNFFDLCKIYELIEQHNKEIHFFKSQLVVNKDSAPDEFLRLDLDVALARVFILRLKQETKKGVLEKCEQGDFPGLAPLGYKNDKESNTIHEFDPKEVHWVKRGFELMRSRLYSIESCRLKLQAEGCPKKMIPGKSSMERILKNPFYYGAFRWWEKLYQGNHPKLITFECWKEVQDYMARRATSGITKHVFPYGGLMVCARCGCTITAERQKGHDYYHCTHNRGDCGNNRYYRDRVIDERLVEALRRVKIDAAFADWVVDMLAANATEANMKKESQIAILRQQAQKLRGRCDGAYQDKLDGKITEEEWVRRTREWEEEIICNEANIKRLELETPASYLMTAKRVLELAKRMPDIAISLKPEERRPIVNLVCSNLKLDLETLHVDYAIPFNLMVEKPQVENWGPWFDDFRTWLTLGHVAQISAGLRDLREMVPAWAE